MINPKTAIYLSLAGLVLIGGFLFQDRFSKQATLEAAIDLSTVTSVTINDRTFSVEEAVSEEQKRRGLGGRESLAEDTGMLFVFSSADQPYFWMDKMEFSIDIIWIYDQKIIGINRNLPVPNAGTPTLDLPTYPAPALVDHVLEVNAGAAAEFKVGDAVKIERSSSI